MKKVLYIDMDNVLVDFPSGIAKLDEATKEKYKDNYDDTPGIFSLMDPLPDAITSFNILADKYDTYILSTAPWKNPSAWSDKVLWVQKYLGDKAWKRLIISHHKNMNKDQYLIDDREKNGAKEFDGEHILFGSEKFKDWQVVLKYLLNINKIMSPPSYYCEAKYKIKAFILGCDPTAFTKQEHQKFKKGEITAFERHPIPFTKAFDLGHGLKYFQTINANLEELGLKYKEDIYVQNLVPQYQKEETSKNKLWKTVAESNIQERKNEFDEIDLSGKLPVFLTSELLYKVLLNDKKNLKTPKELYDPDGEIIIPASENLLGRPLIPLFRHPDYSLKKRTEYRDKLISLLCLMN